ncbi:hypothetical protein B0I33_107317 [Prauserella shujinwangii]|uniref:Uncharacterized protein n=1 Tax=Prauserella shujinwangii TaxID=1453103 RepID=A0A2T0LSU3_9PSEU|nr:hypothetical protein B0I33_107317 [Prauserella shujinwangii]
MTWLAGASFGIGLAHQQLGYPLGRVLPELGVPDGWLRLSVVGGAIVVAGGS